MLSVSFFLLAHIIIHARLYLFLWLLLCLIILVLRSDGSIVYIVDALPTHELLHLA